MIICGVKLSHDAAIAVIDNGKLAFSIELEKINNNPKHANFTLTFEQCVKLLEKNGYPLKCIDRFVFDGWHSEEHGLLSRNIPGLKLSPYGDSTSKQDLLSEKESSIKGLNLHCKSYNHIAGHVAGAYCSSSFPSVKKSSFILVWDEEMVPQLFYYSFKENLFTSLGDLGPLPGAIYHSVVREFLQFKGEELEDILERAMAYERVGEIQDELVRNFRQSLLKGKSLQAGNSTRKEIFSTLKSWCKTFTADSITSGYSAPDLVVSFRKFLESLLVEGLTEVCGMYSNYEKNLCLAGGVTLNAWNGAIRDSGLFNDVSISPFSGDSGNAIGAACCEMLKYTNTPMLEWTLYSGPSLNSASIKYGWERYECSIERLVDVLFTCGEPIVFLSGRAELGPSSLGSRCIISPATDGSMKPLLDTVMQTENYGTITAICLDEHATHVFCPGTNDPFANFSHTLRSEWTEKLPALSNADGTVRLLTISQKVNQKLHELVSKYYQLTGIPVLCMTGANFRGAGPFPDVKSAMEWGRLNIVWSEGFIYLRRGYSRYHYGFIQDTVKENNVRKGRGELTMSTLGTNGNLGNQLFQYASLIGLSIKYDAELRLPDWPYAKYFNHHFPKGEPRWEVTKDVKEPTFKFVNDWRALAESESVNIYGFLQSEKYWEQCKSYVLTALTFSKHFVEQCTARFGSEILKNAIAISIRRGDFVSNPNYLQLPITSYYLQTLFECFPDWRDRKIIIFSDDMPYCRVHFSTLKNVYFSENNSAIEDLCLMSQCRDFIISNSTFSWWGAYLAMGRGKVIRPKKNFDGRLADYEDDSDFFPEEWSTFNHQLADNLNKRIDLKDVTFMIPVAYDSEERRENVELCINILLKDFECDIIICEQIMSNASAKFDYLFRDHLYHEMTHYMQFRDDVFHRTKMVNMMAYHSKTKYIFIWDADVIIPPLQIFQAVELLRCGVDMVFPYRWAFARVPRDRWFQRLRDYQDVGIVGDTRFNGMNTSDEVSMCGAVGFCKNSFVQAGMENENLIGSNLEAFERVSRFKKLGFKIGRALGENLYHINHFISTNDGLVSYLDQNKMEYSKVETMSKGALRKYIATWHWLLKETNARTLT